MYKSIDSLTREEWKEFWEKFKQRGGFYSSVTGYAASGVGPVVYRACSGYLSDLVQDHTIMSCPKCGGFIGYDHEEFCNGQ